LTNQIASLKIQKQDLERQNHSIIALSAYSIQIVEFYFASATALFRKEVKRLVLIAAFIGYHYLAEARLELMKN